MGRLRDLFTRIATGRRARDPVDEKRAAEFAFWEQRAAASPTGTLDSGHYRDIYTTGFGLPLSFFAGKRFLDIGCGPRGSLEWADMAAERVGLDPLADDYRSFGTERHAMTYVSSPAERMPFPDASFDVVATCNSLDHVDDLDATIAEIKRVSAPGGTLLLITEVGHQPTPTEPLTFGFEVLDLFAPEFTVDERWDFEMVHELVYASLLAAVPYDHDEATPRSGILRARSHRSA